MGGRGRAQPFHLDDCLTDPALGGDGKRAGGSRGPNWLLIAQDSSVAKAPKQHGPKIKPLT